MAEDMEITADESPSLISSAQNPIMSVSPRLRRGDIKGPTMARVPRPPKAPESAYPLEKARGF